MFICPQCNQFVADPTFVPRATSWTRSAWPRRLPICPSGHILQSRVLGGLKELSLPSALLRGLAFSCALLAVGVLQDSAPYTGRRAVGLLGMDASMLIVGVTALCRAWIWAGMEGPVRRLTPRALGMAVGYLVPVIPASNELYFHWTHFAAGPSGRLLTGLSQLIDLIFR